METKNSGYYKEHLLNKKENIIAGTTAGLIFGALFANPIGLFVGAIVGASLGYAMTSNKNKPTNDG